VTMKRERENCSRAVVLGIVVLLLLLSLLIVERVNAIFVFAVVTKREQAHDVLLSSSFKYPLNTTS
jgi:hypothetical protein